MRNAVKAEDEIIRILRTAGLREGDRILDFGCGSGTYAIPAAQIAGDPGTVLVLDKDKQKISDLIEKAKNRKLKNVVRLNPQSDSTVRLKDDTLTAVILFDVLHQYYFPSAASRRHILEELHRVLKPGGLLLVHPTHIDRSTISGEIGNAGFNFKGTCSGKMLHDGRSCTSSILVFNRT